MTVWWCLVSIGNKFDDSLMMSGESSKQLWWWVWQWLVLNNLIMLYAVVIICFFRIRIIWHNFKMPIWMITWSLQYANGQWTIGLCIIFKASLNSPRWRTKLDFCISVWLLDHIVIMAKWKLDNLLFCYLSFKT